MTRGSVMRFVALCAFAVAPAHTPNGMVCAEAAPVHAHARLATLHLVPCVWPPGLVVLVVGLIRVVSVPSSCVTSGENGVLPGEPEDRAKHRSEGANLKTKLPRSQQNSRPGECPRTTGRITSARRHQKVAPRRRTKALPDRCRLTPPVPTPWTPPARAPPLPLLPSPRPPPAPFHRPARQRECPHRRYRRPSRWTR